MLAFSQQYFSIQIMFSGIISLLKNHQDIICVRACSHVQSSTQGPSELCLTLSLRSTVIKLRLPNSNNCACFLLTVIIFMSLFSCTFICKSQLRFVSCGVFTKLNENSDSDSDILYLWLRRSQESWLTGENCMLRTED